MNPTNKNETNAQTEPKLTQLGQTIAPAHSHSANDFDLSNLRLPQNFGQALSVAQLITNVPLRKPSKGEFFRVNPDPNWKLETMLLELKSDGETYIVLPCVFREILDLIRPVVLHGSIDRKGNFFLIPCPLPGPDGKINQWHQSLACIIQHAEKKWVRSTANLAAGSYDLFVATGIDDEPIWPDAGFAELIKIAFRNKIINSPEHPIIKQLLGMQ